MKKLIIPITVVLVLGLFISLFFFLGNKPKSFDTKTSVGEATIDLTPKSIENGKFNFKIAINTHSVSLENYNLMKLSTLNYDGKSVRPVSALKLSGHHNNGEISFNIGNDKPSKFKVIITGIPDIEERVFEWD